MYIGVYTFKSCSSLWLTIKYVHEPKPLLLVSALKLHCVMLAREGHMVMSYFPDMYCKYTLSCAICECFVIKV